MNSKPWIRLYKDSLHNPKIVTLTDRQHRGWHNLTLIADDEGGILPKSRDIACHLRMTVFEVDQLLCELVEAELVDIMLDGSGRFRMHDWETHQYVSDTSTERVRKFRNKNNETFHVTERNVSVTPSDTDTDSETDTDNNLAHSSFVKPREEKEQSFKFDLKTTKKGKDFGKSDGVVRRAEGLGLPVDELIATTNANPAVRSRGAYFTTLCVDRLQKLLPGIDEQLARDALWGKDGKSFAAVSNLLLNGALQ